MANPQDRPEPWLIAAWPGMGNVAVIAAGYLVQQLGMSEAGELPSRDHFDISEIEVSGGLIKPVRLPRAVFFRWNNPHGGRDLVILLAESQPTTHIFTYANELLDAAAEMGVRRIVTFASMACGLHPSQSPKVWGIATDKDMLAQLRRAEVELLPEGQIGGLNGVLLAAGAQRGIPGLCLMAEIPFFAASVANPKASRVALSVFSVLAGIDISLDELNKHAAAVDRALIDALEKMERNRSGDEGEPEEEKPEEPAEPAGTEPPPPPEPKLDLAARRRIERLFEAASKDTSRAMELKKELDRAGVFKKYEDRFLDLFRRAD